MECAASGGALDAKIGSQEWKAASHKDFFLRRRTPKKSLARKLDKKFHSLPRGV